MTLLCEIEDCENLAAWHSKDGDLCHKHHREVTCSCSEGPRGEDWSDPLCVVHGDERDTSIDRVRLER